uniref:non-specific serine/threonine protein kinase n=1 Tax=Bionectria ochroleuca TaxID=29856 RepID=A0A8H7N087_BIOOC
MAESPCNMLRNIRPSIKRAKRSRSNLIEAAASCLISDDDFRQKLHKFLPVRQDSQRPQKIRLRDQEFNYITELLLMRGKKEWALRPRHFVILYMIGLEQVMDSFVTDERSDYFLPYTEDNLPDALTGENRAHFLAYQNHVLDGQGVSLESGGARHQNCQGDARSKFFYTKRRLGQGGSQIYRSQVDHVIGKHSLMHFALKTIPRQHIDDTKDRKILKLFQNELEVLQFVDHQHIVKVVGSYTDASVVGILMTPVADQDLAAFLEKKLPPSGEADRRLRIRTFFGCIATAIDYLHNNKIKGVQHKDIKPKNILVKESKVYLTDFGTAQVRREDVDDTAESSTNPSMKFVSKRYAPLEAVIGTRTRASDIWSLGCVFVEMLTVLAGKSMQDLSQFLQDKANGSGSTAYYENERGLQAWLQYLRGILSNEENPQDAILVDVVEAMCRSKKEERLTASDLVRRIFKLEEPTMASAAVIGQAFNKSWESDTFDVTDVEDCDTVTDPVNVPAEAEEDKADPRNLLEDVTELIPPPLSQTIKTRNFVEDVGMLGPSLSRMPEDTKHASRPLLSPEATTLCPWPGCNPSPGVSNQVFDSMDKLRQHLRDTHLVHDFGWTHLQGDSGTATLKPEEGRFELKRIKRVRFSGLPEEQVIQSKALQRSHGNRSSELGIPPNTYVPSYLLVANNRFSAPQLRQRLAAEYSRPLFVYGTLMFPSVLRAQAEHFLNPDGIYSSSQGRRLRTVESDWGRINDGIREAAKQGTPAVLPGYSRFCLRQYSLAYIQPSEQGETRGFLIFGLSAEALACLDHLYERGGPRHFFDGRRKQSAPWSMTELVRQRVTVRTNVNNGDTINIEADTYVANTEEWRVPKSAESWDMTRFLCSKSYAKITHSSRRDMVEEQSIAKELGTNMVMPGDRLVEAVLDNNYDELWSLIDEGHDVDMASSRYGTALQAAASKGNIPMMHQLIEASANINGPGGEYGSPLMASVVEGHFDAMKLLLRHKAKLFACGGKYVSPLYQAVSFDRLDMVHALLEKGAWLTRDYRELLDLATERNNDEIYEELLRYDVLQLAKKRLPGNASSASSDTDDSNGDEEVELTVSKSVGAICLFEAFKLYNRPGKWTGIKLVKVLKAGFERGLNDKILEQIRPHIHSFPALQRFFTEALDDMFGGGFGPVRHTDPIDDLPMPSRAQLRVK